MFKFCNLYSGSSGNSSLIESDNAKILVDCGTSCKKITDALNNMNIDASTLDGILITHEHSDHVKGLSVISKKYHIPIYINEKTFDSLNFDTTSFDKIFFKTNEDFSIKDLKVHPFSIPHDAADPCGFAFFYGNNKVSIATDVGHINNSIIDNLSGSSFVLLESNYEPDLLKSSFYPYSLKKRILGPNGHLSNEDAGEAISVLAKNGVNKIALGHLSKENNFPELAYKTVLENIINNKVDVNNLSISVAHRDKPDEIINIAWGIFMLHINIYCVGKIKENFLKDAITEYSKRLSKYCTLQIIEVPDKAIPEKSNASIEKQIIDFESSEILNKIDMSSYKIALDLSGKQFSSEELAAKINDIAQINSTISFIIGGSLGLNDEVRNICNEKISFSKMTFPHQLMRVILLEQIFRAFKINNNEKYHH